MEVQIKKGDASRLEDCLKIMRDSPLYDHYYAPDETILREMLEDALGREILFMAETSGGEAVGLMICEWKGMLGAYPYLALLGVRKNFRGMGVGHRLLEAFEKISRGLKARNIFICVSAFNPRARTLYTSMGFRKIALVPDCIKNGVAENILMKRIG